MRDALELQKTLPLEHTEGWFAARFDAATSSQYAAILNQYNDRANSVYRSVHRIRTIPNFQMRWGTVFEDCSGMIFSHMTDMVLHDLGSVEHEQRKRIRGTVDGWGTDGKESWILETKTHCSIKPGDGIENATYYYQVVQNIEILDADVGYFNAVRFLPTLIGKNEHICLEPSLNYKVDPEFKRYKLAKKKPVTMLLANVYKRTPPDPGPFKTEACKRAIQDMKSVTEESMQKVRDLLIDGAFNCCDLYLYGLQGKKHDVGQLARYETLFHVFIMMPEYIIIPQSICDTMDFDTWLAAQPVAPRASGRLTLMIDIVLIERIERQKEFWETQLLPLSQQWLEDVRVAKETGVVPTRTYDGYPLPPDAPGSLK